MEDIEKSYCIRCDFETNHRVLFRESILGVDNDFAIDYMVVRCLGCDRISFREEVLDFISAYPNQDGDWIPDITINTYPEKLRVTQRLENTHVLPEKIRSVYEEAIKAFNADCFLLTGVAFRAVIEAICIESGIVGRNLEIKINNLTRQKLITEKEAKRLHSIRFIGNDSIHEMKVPTESSLRIVLNIIDNLLNNLYLIDHNSRHHLETVIDEYSSFISLLKSNLKRFKSGDEIPLAKILDKNVRRLNGKLNDFETELIGKITSGEYNLLSVGKIDAYGNNSNKIQHFIVL